MTSKLISPTNETPEFPPHNPPYNEELAVLLEDEDETAWKNLLQEVSPQFGDPIAAQIANIMHSRMAGKYVGKLIRKMLVDKAIADSTEGHGPEEDSEDEDPGPEAEYSDEDSYSEYEPITWAIRDKNITKLKILLNKGRDVDEYDSDIDQTPLELAIEMENSEIMELLLDNGADVNGKNHCFSPLYSACGNGNTEIVGLLLDKGAKVNGLKNQCFPPLFSACKNGNTEIVGLLLDKGANINITESEDAFTPLMWAIISKQTEIVGLLIDKGADLNTYDEQGETALDWAENRKEKEIVKILKDEGARTSSDIWFKEEQKRCLSMLDQKTLDKLNEMSDDERKEAMHWLTEDFLMTGPLAPLEPVYVPPKERLGIK